MFNEELKNRYIKEKRESTIIGLNFLERQFINISSYEEELNKDLSNFTTPEIIEYYKILGSRSLESLTVINSQYSMYTQWCLQQNLVIDSQNHYLEMNSDILSQCLNQTIIDKSVVTREELLNMVYQLPNYRDQFIFLYLFEVGKDKDFFSLTHCKLEDFDKEKKTLYLKNRIPTVSDELIRIAEEADKQEIYYSITQKEIRKITFAENGYIIKDIPPAKPEEISDFRRGRRVYTAIVRNLEYLGVGKCHTARTIINSGIIQMIYQRSAELKISREEYIRKYTSEIKEQYNVSLVVPTFLKKYEKYL